MQSVKQLIGLNKALIGYLDPGKGMLVFFQQKRIYHQSIELHQTRDLFLILGNNTSDGQIKQSAPLIPSLGCLSSGWALKGP